MDPYFEISNIWKDLQAQAQHAGYDPAKVVNRTPVLELIIAAEEQATHDRPLLQPWLAMTELAIELLHALHRFALAVRADAELPPSFALLLGRACGIAVAIRRLVLSGLDESANVLLRSFFENLDIALVTLDDADFAANFAAATDSKTFWRKHIASGKIHRRAEEVLKRSGLAEPVLADRRRRDWSLLSASTHSSFISAFRGAAVISLATGDLIPSPLGHLGMMAPIILDRTAKETSDFAAAAMRLAVSFAPPRGFERDRSAQEPLLRSVTGAFFTLQEMLKRHGNDIERHTTRMRQPSVPE